MSRTNDKPVNRSPANSKESPPLKPVQSREPESEGDNPNLHDEALVSTEGERAMTEFKHTPGPWMARAGAHRWNVTTTGAPRTFNVASINSDRIEQATNARLIAAAPEMLEAIERLRVECALCALERGEDWNDPRLNNLLAKIKGE